MPTVEKCYNKDEKCSWLFDVLDGSLNILVRVTTMNEFLLFDESETLILFEGSRPENKQNFQEKIISMSNTSNNFKNYMWILVEYSQMKKDFALDFPLLAESENVRLDSQIYAVTLTSEKIAVYELYRTWWNTPLISSLILILEDHKIVYQGDFIWNRRKNLQGLQNDIDCVGNEILLCYFIKNFDSPMLALLKSQFQK